MERRRLRESRGTSFGERGHDPASIGVCCGARDQAFVHESVDASSHAGARAVRLGRELTDAQPAAGLAEVSQDVEVAQGEANGLDKVSGELAHERGVRADERLPGLDPVLVRHRLAHQPVEEPRDVGL